MTRAIYSTSLIHGIVDIRHYHSHIATSLGHFTSFTASVYIHHLGPLQVSDMVRLVFGCREVITSRIFSWLTLFLRHTDRLNQLQYYT